MKKFLLAAIVMLAFAMPSFAMTTEYGIGTFESITVRTPIGDNLKLNLGVDYKAVNTIVEMNAMNMKTNVNGVVYMPLIGVDYGIYQKENLSVSLGANLMFIIAQGNVSYSDNSADGGNATEEAMNDQIEEFLKNFSSMILDVYARTNYKVAQDLSLFSTFGLKGLGATYDPDGAKYGLGVQTLYTKIGVAYDLF